MSFVEAASEKGEKVSDRPRCEHEHYVDARTCPDCLGEEIKILQEKLAMYREKPCKDCLPGNEKTNGR